MNISFVDLKSIRQKMYETFSSRPDASFNVVDTLCSRQNAQSIAELSLEEPFERSYCSVYDSVDHFFTPNSDSGDGFNQRQEKAIERFAVVAPYLPPPNRHPFYRLPF